MALNKKNKPVFKKKPISSFFFGIETWIYISVALALGVIIPRFNQWFVWRESPVDKTTMSTILSSIASGMITLSGIVFSLVFVLVQFGSATYSPRITKLFENSLALRHSLGVFTGTFLYSLMALRMIGMEQAARPSLLTVWVAFIWLLASVITLAKLVQVFTTLTITNLLVTLDRIGRKSIDRTYQTYSSVKKPIQHFAGGLGENVRKVFYDGEPLYVAGYDFESLVMLACKSDAVICLPYSIGDALKDGAPIAIINGNKASISESKITSAIQFGYERTFLTDPKYALRLLVDTAIRALSPGINDPTTAVQSLDHIESLLRRLGNCNLDIGKVSDSEGMVRVIYKTPSWEDYLQLGLVEIMHYGAASIQVQRRLASLLRFLEESVPPERVKEITRFKEQCQLLIKESFTDIAFREWANTSDREGIGSSSELPEFVS